MVSYIIWIIHWRVGNSGRLSQKGWFDENCSLQEFARGDIVKIRGEMNLTDDVYTPDQIVRCGPQW